MNMSVLRSGLTVLFGLSINASAHALDCSVTLLTMRANNTLLTNRPDNLPSEFHSEMQHPENAFFRFTVSDESDELYLHQNLCINGKSIKDQKLKGWLCLLVSSGAKQIPELGSESGTDSYLSKDSKVLTFQVFHSIKDKNPASLSSRRYLINAASEVAWPVSSYRGNFQGDGAGLGALTITCE
jgi:hypothetical protein